MCKDTISSLVNYSPRSWNARTNLCNWCIHKKAFRNGLLNWMQWLCWMQWFVLMNVLLICMWGCFINALLDAMVYVRLVLWNWMWGFNLRRVLWTLYTWICSAGVSWMRFDACKRCRLNVHLWTVFKCCNTTAFITDFWADVYKGVMLSVYISDKKREKTWEKCAGHISPQKELNLKNIYFCIKK